MHAGFKLVAIDPAHLCEVLDVALLVANIREHPELPSILEWLSSYAPIDDGLERKVRTLLTGKVTP